MALVALIVRMLRALVPKELWPTQEDYGHFDQGRSPGQVANRLHRPIAPARTLSSTGGRPAG
jgi:hypothetical protein